MKKINHFLLNNYFQIWNNKKINLTFYNNYKYFISLYLFAQELCLKE